MALIDTLNFYTYTQLHTYSYQTINGTVYFSVRVSVKNSRDLIGRVSPANVCNVEFDSTADIEKWECRATLDGQPHGAGIGLLLKSGNAVKQGVSSSFNVTNTSLTLGDGMYRISVYVQKNNIWYGG